MDSYKIAKDSEVTDAQVDKLHFREGRDDVHQLTKGQVERLEAVGVTLEQTTKAPNTDDKKGKE